MRLLGLDGEKFTPQQIMTAILKLNTDLLWFGGIGTYIRAASETDDQVGDRVNDPIRITGAALRCKVVGEGANLGATQRGRVEAALRGIRLNTDAIDNSAGVNTSDLEVNIKIALNVPLRAGDLPVEARDTLLAEMTDEVGRLVLRNNYQQTLALSLAQRRGLEDLGFHQRLMQTLETRGELDRAVEYLPDDMELGERRKRGHALTRPELAVLLAYAKLSLYGDLLESSVPDDAYLGRELSRYFPKELVERYPDALEQHRLRREIISTQLTNSMINRGGPAFTVRIADQTGAAPATIAAAFFVTRNSYDMIALNSAIDALDNKVPGKLQLDLYAAIEDLLLDRIVWFVRNVDVSKGLAEVVEHYRAGIEAVASSLDRVLPEEGARSLTARANSLINAGVPEDLARRIASLPALAAAPDIVSVADRTGKNVQDVAATYFAADAFFQLDKIAGAARGINVTDYFDRLALDRALDSIGEAERRLTAEMVGQWCNGTGCGGCLGDAACRRGGAHPRRRARHRELGPYALEAHGRGEPAGRFGKDVTPPRNESRRCSRSVTCRDAPSQAGCCSTGRHSRSSRSSSRSSTRHTLRPPSPPTRSRGRRCGVSRRPRPDWSSPRCRRCSVRSPMRADGANRGSRDSASCSFSDRACCGSAGPATRRSSR